MKKIVALFISCVIGLISANSQVIIHSDSLVGNEETGTTLCYNNSSLMAGNTVDDRYLLYFNSDTIFLNVRQSAIRTRKIAYTGSNILLASLTLNRDTIWICWKESAYIKTRYSSDKGDTWSNVLNVSAAGNVSAPSMFASSNGKIHFVWFNESTNDTTVVHNVYFNGSFLTSPNTLSTTGVKASWPSVTAIGDTVLCAWKETQSVAKIYFARSFNGGQAGSWTPSAFTNGATTGKDPSLSYAYDANTTTHYVYLVYDGTQKIYLQRSTDFGGTWTSADVISNTAKKSQFAKVESNNSGFVGVSWEHRTVVSLFDDTKKDVGFAYSTNWANSGSFGNDSLAYTYAPFGSPLAIFNKIDENNFYLVWLSNDTILNRQFIYERRIEYTTPTEIRELEDQQSSIRIYPNPTKDFITIENKDQSRSNLQIKILDVFGKEIFEKLMTQNIEMINVSFLPSGMYLIKAINTDIETHTLIIYK